MKSKDAVDGRLVLLQAQRRWEEQQDEFVRRRRDHEMRMIAMEATEAERREDEIRRRIEGLDEQKRKNRWGGSADPLQGCPYGHGKFFFECFEAALLPHW